MAKPEDKNTVKIVRIVVGEAVDGDADAIAAFRLEREQSEAFEERRRATWPHNSDDGRINMHAAMSKLANLFPGLHGRPGAEPWDALAVLRYLCTGGGSHGEKLAARFLLNVWNSDADWEKEARANGIENAEVASARFDVFEAVSTWDHDHRAAFVTWVNTPFWP